MVTKREIITSKTEEQIAIEKREVVDPIKKAIPKAPSGRTHGITLPAYISFTINKENKTLLMYMQQQKCSSGEFVNYTSDKNMQEENAAFEGWAICLKAWLPEKIDKVVLKWDQPESKTPHYNRFLYRVLRFSEFYDWFSIDSSNIHSVDEFKKGLTGLSNNYFSAKPKLKEGHDKSKLSESIVEYLFANSFSKPIKEFYNLKMIDRQFPVGVKRDGNQFFTSGMSAIDLWGTNDNTLTIIELKYHENYRVGIISELFLYTCVMQDIISGVIAGSKHTQNHNEKNFYDNVGRYKIIHAEMLSDKYHPLVNSERVIEIMNNQSLSKNAVKVVYRRTQYKLNQLVDFL
jgi:hypothetical protein